MTQLNRVAFIGNSLPRRCGIATFTSDLQQAIAASGMKVDTRIVAMTDHGHDYEYPDVVSLQINDDRMEDYENAADFLNAGQFDVVSLQHEFGIFGGDAGCHLLTLLERLRMPVVTTLHTVLAAPTPAQRAVMDRIAAASAKIVVMAEKGRSLLRTIYAVPEEKIEVIAHGIPDCPFVEPDNAKARLGYSGRTVILTFGLLSPNKGIEIMIDAMPAVLLSQPDAVYVVLGATHPNLVRHQGEAYRDSLVARAHALGIQDHVVFLDQFVDKATLLDFISMCDVYVTPYLNEAQMTSGTLAYSFGLGRAIVSTPYWHAQELLADGLGSLVPFGDSGALGNEIAGLLSDVNRRQTMRRRAYAASRPMTWQRTAERYVTAFDGALRGQRIRAMARVDTQQSVRHRPEPPEMQIGHFLSMCDDTGLFQHAIWSVPDRAHGYCVDDNARALLLACALNNPDEQPLTEVLTARLAAFIQHAWNPDTRRFRNFMGFNRTWLEASGSEDSHGRTLWALGECSRSDINPSRRQWAGNLFAAALTSVADFQSPRAWAFTLLGLDSYCARYSADNTASGMRTLLADRLCALLAAVETTDWTWFESGLAYDNARLAQALIVTGQTVNQSRYLGTGLRTLRWLMAIQTTQAGLFRPVGTHGFGEHRTRPQPFDQQPLEATAAVSACLAAWRVDGDGVWRSHAVRAFAWFLGDNDLSLPLVDENTGACRDGLHPDRVNENMGGESVLSYLLALAEIRQLARISGDHLKFAPFQAVPAD